MSTAIERPLRLQIDAWDGVQSASADLPARTPWAQRRQGDPFTKWLAPPSPADLRDWQHPDVGWGLVLPDAEGLSLQARVRGDDAPDAIQKLLRARPNSPVLRWFPALGQDRLRRYYPDGRAQDLSIAAPSPGTADGRIPRYLLIYASPSQIPWAVQYAMNMSMFVGRLDLIGAELDRYVEALISDWRDMPSHTRAPVVWSVDHGRGDITWLMARAIAGRLWQRFEADDDLTGRCRLKDDQATCGALTTALAERTPALVVTTSHGMTGPVGDGLALRAQLGLPVDIGRQVLRLQDLASWNPSGAIWYAHACCSAGSDAVSRYSGLMPADSAIGKTLDGVAAGAGATISPLPHALLGAEAPLRAFIGHVEPTFDWTLQDPVTKQVLTHVLCEALYNDLFQADRRTPIGFALRRVFAEAGAFFGAYQDAIAQINANVAGGRDWALYRQLAALDRQTLVIIGDPTVSLPPLEAQGQ